MIRGVALQGDPADSVFFIEQGDCQVGYNQRRTADEDLVSTVSSHLGLSVPAFFVCRFAQIGHTQAGHCFICTQLSPAAGSCLLSCCGICH